MSSLAKILPPLIAGVIGLAIWMMWPTWIGFALFATLFFIGSSVGERMFKRYATEDEVKADLRRRNKFGGG